MSQSSEFLQHTLGVHTRLTVPPAPEMVETIYRERFRAATAYHRPETLGDMAHVIMLVEQGIVPRDDGKQILRALRDMYAIEPEAFPFDPSLGDVYFARESYLSGRLGDEIGGWMHLGRSRGEGNDVAMRIAIRDRLIAIGHRLVAFERTLMDVAAKHADTIMAGYSQFIHGQIVTFGHYLLSYVYPMHRDYRRLLAAYRAVNQSVLGAGVLAGSAFPIDRQRTADLLGFDAILRHPRDAVWLSHDSFLEAASALTLLLLGVGRLACDLTLWAGSDFDLIELADQYCGTSSIMPHKKNPITLEYLRGLSGATFGRLMGLLAVAKEPTDQIDFSIFYPGAMIALLDETDAALRLITGIVGTLIVNRELMAVRARAHFAQASTLAESIVRDKQLSWRVAHRIVGRLVRIADDRGIHPDQLTSATFDEAAKAVTGKPLGLSDAGIRRALDPVEIVRQRTLMGGTAPEQIQAMLRECQAETADEARTLDEISARLARVKADVFGAVDRILAT